jgi:hypothetical protein
MFMSQNGNGENIVSSVWYIFALFLQKLFQFCYHGMARPQFSHGEDGLQIWRVAANILNKHQRTADKEWSSSLGVGRGLTTPHRKTPDLFRNFLKSLGPGRESFIFCTHHQTSLGRSNQGEWGRPSTWHAWERGEKCRGFWWEIPKEKYHSEGQGVDGRMGSKWTLGRLFGGCAVDLPGSG